MSQYKFLRDSLTKRPVLALENGHAELVTVKKAQEKLRKATTTFGTVLLHDAARSLANFADIVGTEDRPFNLTEIGPITGGTPYSQLNLWVKEGIIIPTVRDSGGVRKERLFDWRDAYIAGVVGSLHRQGVRLPALRETAQLFYRLKRTTQQPKAPSKRRKKRPTQ